MQIVIEIDDDNYATIQEEYKEELMSENGEISNETVNIILDAFYKGTPLPKGHGRLIDADEIQFENTEFDTYGDYCIAFDAIDQAETVLEADKKI